jgi:hypothetical protein
LAENRRQLARAFTEKLLTFATGREMGFSDRDEINRIANQAMEPGKGIRDLVKSVVNSEIFKTK